MMQMLCVPTHLGPSLVPAMRDTEEMGSRVQVSTSVLTGQLCGNSILNTLIQTT